MAGLVNGIVLKPLFRQCSVSRAKMWILIAGRYTQCIERHSKR